MRTCTVCRSPERLAIEREILAGTPYRRIAAQRGLAPSSVRRHEVGHLPEGLVRAKEAEAIASACDLLSELRRLGLSALEDASSAAGIYENLLAEAASGDKVADRKLGLALKALEVKGRAEERVVRVIALHARIRGELDARRRELEAEKVDEITIKYENVGAWRDFVTKVVQDPEDFAAARRLQALMSRQEASQESPGVSTVPPEAKKVSGDARKWTAID
jgi:hypothetical protein